MRLVRAAAAWCILLLYLGAYSPAGLAATMLAASCDRNHHLLLASSEHGMQLVLRHSPNCPRHHHGAVARILTFFAEPLSAANPDHVIQFTSANGVLRKADATPAAPDKLAQPLCDLVEISAVVTNQTVLFASANRLDSTDSGQFIRLRSTVLLL